MTSTMDVGLCSNPCGEADCQAVVEGASDVVAELTGASSAAWATRKRLNASGRAKREEPARKDWELAGTASKSGLAGRSRECRSWVGRGER